MSRVKRLEEVVKKAVDKFLYSDFKLLAGNVNERSLTHKLAEYLQMEFPDWNVDCEYNRNLGERKIAMLPTHEEKPDWDDLEARTVFPDIIVHKRGVKNNLLIIEVKKTNSKVPDAHDLAKLSAFRKEPFNYKFGLFIKFDVGPRSKSPSFLWVSPAAPPATHRRA